MTLPQTNFDPPFNITRASHLTFTSRDLARSRDFYTEVIGLKVTDETATTIYLRGVEERAHHSLTLKKTKEEAACERVGFRVFTEEDLDRAKAHFDKAGISAKFVNLPFQGRTLHVSDTAGTPLEFCARMKTLPRVQTRTHEHKGASALRMDHYQVLVPDAAKAASFYTELGFRVSDYICVGEERIIGIFLFRKDNPHDMVFLTRSGPRFHHFGYIVQEMHHVVRALDAAGNLGFAANIEHGPGRHGHGHSYYVYLRDPDGHRIELLLSAVQIIDIDDEPMRYDVKPGNSNLWGLPPPRMVRGHLAADRRDGDGAAGCGRSVHAGEVSVRAAAGAARRGAARQEAGLAGLRPATTRSLCTTPRYFSSTAVSVARVALAA